MPTAKIDLTGQRFGHEYNGETHTVAEWARILSIDAAALYRRLYRGLPVEKVFAIAASKGA